MLKVNSHEMLITMLKVRFHSNWYVRFYKNNTKTVSRGVGFENTTTKFLAIFNMWTTAAGD